MTYQTKVILAGISAVIAYDLFASLASRSLGFPYARAGVGSSLIYALIGYLAARRALSSPIRSAAIAAAIPGLADASLGWAVSWVLGPGQLPEGTSLTVGRWIGTALVVVLLASVVGALGGIVGRRAASSQVRAA